LTVTGEERATLQRWARRAKSSQALALRARIVLAYAENADNKQVARELGVHQATVGKWRSRFIERRLGGLCDEDRPGRPPSVTDEQVEHVIIDTLERTPEDATHWSRASMAKNSGLSKAGDRADLEGVQAQAAPGRWFQGEHRPAVHREGARCGRAVREPACAVRR